MNQHAESFDEEVKPRVPPDADSIAWNDLFLRDEIRRAIKEIKFERPSQVQMEAIPFALQGCDLLCQSKSGTGKTMVFVLTILNSLVVDKETGMYVTGQAVIVVNTRELAHQINKEFLKLGKYFRQPALRVGCYFGGISVMDNCEELATLPPVPTS
ncbi:uncharacterized protein LOC116245036 [Nymphaea colorata]|nr:uncharacterized protein LOC116245036 [Nymphaea colorata]